MFHKVKAVNALPDYRLSVQFAEGVTKIYDVKPLFAKLEPFKSLENDPALFSDVEVDVAAMESSGTMISICHATSCLKNGKTVKTPIPTETMKREYGQPKEIG